MATMEHVAILPDEISPAVVHPMLAARGKASFIAALSAAREWQVEAKYTTTAGSTSPRSPEIRAPFPVELQIRMDIFVSQNGPVQRRGQCSGNKNTCTRNAKEPRLPPR